MVASVDGTATILAIGTANPPECLNQAEFANLYLRITNCDEIVPDQIRDRFKRICEKTKIDKRYFHMTEETLKDNPDLCVYKAPTLNKRHEIAKMEVPKLGKEAALKAIDEWGQPVSKITHLVMCTYSSIDMPGADYLLAKLLGLPPSVKRFMIYQQGCHAGAASLRLAKDLAENNKGARILVVSSEMVAIGFRGPSLDDMNNLIGQVLFGDGAAAIIVGAHPDLSVERPIFEMVWTAQSILPNSEGAIEGWVREEGMFLQLRKDVADIISENIEACLKEAFTPLGIHDWNSIFWVVHPGGPAILDQVEAKLGLDKQKMKASRQVLKDYGNMSSASVLFVLDEMRKKSVEEGQTTTGEGLDWGVLFGFGPGITAETIVLRSVPNKH